MPTIASATLPFTLTTATPAEGFTLARRLADTLAAAVEAGSGVAMPQMLQTHAAARPSTELIAAIYFHAISIANGGWRE